MQQEALKKKYLVIKEAAEEREETEVVA
jgi:hypothetical protein